MDQPAPAPSLSSRLVLRVLLALYRWKGWTITGRAPAARKYVLIGAPHTSNWDFVFFLGGTRDLGIRARFLGKHSLFRWPLGRFMRDMGGIPIDRKARNRNYVEQVADEFARRDELALVIAPEGTRGPITKWRSGFYHIAVEAGVPIVPAWVDYEKRTGGIGEPIEPTGDFARDMRRIAEFYHRALPDHPKLQVLYTSSGIASAD
jgi:1-acyl-sn-glycerol-3-phosphate acyltransferase